MLTCMRVMQRRLNVVLYVAIAMGGLGVLFLAWAK